MSGLVGRVLAENQQRAKKSHLEMLEAIPYFPDAAMVADAGMDADTGLSSPSEDALSSTQRTSISNEEWSNRARLVTGLHNALYTDPKEVPHYEENNEHFVELAPRVKECIRRKNKKLKSRWEGLANQYLARQVMYNESIGLSGNTSERGGVFSAGFSKENEITSSMDGSSSPRGGAPGGGANGDTPSSAGTRGNNPYRRPRRGISPGDVVRSDYEQEQIIAEIAAKEAMEKRIKEGGCALPRQRGWLENVSLSVVPCLFLVCMSKLALIN
jgi:hypothetical protein